MTAPKLDFLLEVLDSRNYNPESYDAKVKEVEAVFNPIMQKVT